MLGGLVAHTEHILNHHLMGQPNGVNRLLVAAAWSSPAGPAHRDVWGNGVTAVPMRTRDVSWPIKAKVVMAS